MDLEERGSSWLSHSPRTPAESEVGIEICRKGEKKTKNLRFGQYTHVTPIDPPRMMPRTMLISLHATIYKPGPSIRWLHIASERTR